jgi:DNA polymerase (family X)
MTNKWPTNKDIVGLLDRIAELLQAQDANDFRIRAYRNAAQTVRGSRRSIAKIAEEEGLDALIALPDIGDGIARVIGEYVSEGRSRLLDQLESDVTPVDLFAKVPGIGPKLAQRVIDTLGIHSLEALEMAAHDGRLDSVEGFGKQRVQDVRNGLAGMLSPSARRDVRQRTRGQKPPDADRPPVSLLLDIDAEYRRKAEKDELKRITPKRFNPEKEAWLPVMNVERDGWSFTVLYSNTARAHELEKTHDWVVIYYKPSGSSGRDRERQNTVVTGTRGALEGRRVVRGREADTRAYYEV